MSEAPKIQKTHQFKFVPRNGKRAFEAHVAIYGNCGRDVGIFAPTVEALRIAYKQFSGQELIGDGQHVWITKA